MYSSEKKANYSDLCIEGKRPLNEMLNQDPIKSRAFSKIVGAAFPTHLPAECKNLNENTFLYPWTMRLQKGQTTEERCHCEIQGDYGLKAPILRDFPVQTW